MYRKVLVGGMTAAAILGAGGTALALTGSDTTTNGTGATSAAAVNAAAHAQDKDHGKGKGKGKERLLKHLAHAEIVTHGKKGFVTHNLIKGSVTAVSPTSITVQAADKTTETFVVGKDTKVRARTDGKGKVSSIDGVATGDQVFVSGTGSPTSTAKRIVEIKK